MIAHRALPTRIQLAKEHLAHCAMLANLHRKMLPSATIAQQIHSPLRSLARACHVRTAVTPHLALPLAFSARVTSIRTEGRAVARIALPERMP